MAFLPRLHNLEWTGLIPPRVFLLQAGEAQTANLAALVAENLIKPAAARFRATAGPVKADIKRLKVSTYIRVCLYTSVGYGSSL